ncbi:MAG: protein kinase family protein [Candidatus Woesearchaeota archaeon]
MGHTVLKSQDENLAKDMSCSLRAYGKSIERDTARLVRAGQKIAGYTIGEVCGSGGISEARYATHNRTGKTRVIKYPRPGMLTAFEDMVTTAFESEAEILGSIRHPNIVRGYKPFKYNDVTYIPMEPLEIGLPEFMQDFSMEKLQVFMESATDALKYLHDPSRAIVHCDIKPQQFMLDLEGTIKLIDFGSARYEGEIFDNVATTETFFPRDARPEKVERPIDMYSFGRTIMSLLLSDICAYDPELRKELLSDAQHETVIEFLEGSGVPEYLTRSIIGNCISSVTEDPDFDIEALEHHVYIFGRDFLEDYTGNIPKHPDMADMPCQRRSEHNHCIVDAYGSSIF